MTVDIFTCVILALAFLVIAWRKRKGARDVASFHIAGWAAGPFALVASLVALFGAGEISTFTEYYDLLGSAILVFFTGVACGFLFVGFNATRFFNLRVLRHTPAVPTAYQINDTVFDRFGPLNGWLFTVLAAVGLLALYLIQVIVGSKLISIGSGVGYVPAVIGVSTVIAVYVILSGLEGIYATDKFQFVALFVGLLAITFYAGRETDIGLSAQYSTFFDSLDVPTGFLLFVTGFFPVVGGADVLQRIISAKGPGDIKRVSFVSAGGWLILGFLLIAFSKGISGYATEDTPGFIGFLDQAEGQIRVVMIVALVCALLSTADTEAHAVGVLINRAIAPQSEPSVFLSRVLIGLTCVFAGALAIYFKEGLVSIYVILLNISLILGPLVVAMAFNRGTTASLLISLVTSFGLFCYFTISDLWFNTAHSMSIQVLSLAVPTLTNLFFAQRQPECVEPGRGK